MIDIKSLSVKYENENSDWILSNFNLKFENNTCIGIIGDNGSGKTTLAHALIGIIPFLTKGLVKGAVLLNNFDFLQDSIDSRLNNISYSFQDVESQILFGNVSDVIGLNEISSPKDLINNIIRILGIQHLLDRNPDELSGGEAQRVALASAFRLDPKFIIYDEATSALDPITKRDFHLLINYLKSHNKSILLLGQRPEILLPYTDDVFMLNDSNAFKYKSNKQKKISLENNTNDFWNNTILNSELNSFNISELFIKELFFLRKKPNQFKIEIRNFKISGGENIAILGKNGSGKTTFLHLLNGLLKANRFFYRINSDNHFDSNNISEYIKTVYHSPNSQIIGTTVDEELFGIEKKIKSEIIKRFSFFEFQKDPLDLSFGQQRLLCLLSSFFSNRPILFIDEPEFGIDSNNIQYIKSYFQLNQKEKIKTIVFTTHDLEFAYELADRCLLMDNGNIIAEIKPNSLIELENWFFQNFAK
jgi:energy-coupling factor transport system ATP-binding protein